MARCARRRLFATPLVAVLGCGRPAPVREATVDELARSELPVDAYARMPYPDASPAEVAREAEAEAARREEMEGHCSGRLRPVWNCNPPPPPPDAMPTANPPAAIFGRVVNLSVVGDTVEIVIDRGTDHGVDKGAHGVLLDADHKPVRGSEFTVSKATARQAWARVKLPVDEVRTNPHVRVKF